MLILYLHSDTRSPIYIHIKRSTITERHLVYAISFFSDTIAQRRCTRRWCVLGNEVVARERNRDDDLSLPSLKYNSMRFSYYPITVHFRLRFSSCEKPYKEKTVIQKTRHCYVTYTLFSLFTFNSSFIYPHTYVIST